MKKCEISRTSIDYDECPYPGAERETYVYSETSAYQEFIEDCYEEDGDEWWYGDGENHREESGIFKRDFESRGWFIYIESLSSFVEYQDHPVIVTSTRGNASFDYRIEIYDDYRE